MVDAKVRAEAIVLADAKVQVFRNLRSWLSQRYGVRRLLGSAIRIRYMMRDLLRWGVLSLMRGDCLTIEAGEVWPISLALMLLIGVDIVEIALDTVNESHSLLLERSRGV